MGLFLREVERTTRGLETPLWGRMTDDLLVILNGLGLEN